MVPSLLFLQIINHGVLERSPQHHVVLLLSRRIEPLVITIDSDRANSSC